MAKTTFTIQNDNTKAVVNKVEKAIYDALDLCGQQAVRNAVINLEHDPRRVDTGLLRNSITYAHSGERAANEKYTANSTHGDTESTKKRGIAGTPVKNQRSGEYTGTAPDDKVETVYIGTNVEYGLYVHEGTQRMEPNRYLRDAIKGHENEYETICKQVFSTVK